MELTKLENIWNVLNELLADLTLKGVEVPRIFNKDLRYARFIIMHYKAFPKNELHEAHKDFLVELREALDRVTDFLLIQAQSKVGRDYFNEWTAKLNRAQTESEKIQEEKLIPFSPDVYARRRDLDFVRITLQEPLVLEKIQDVAEGCGVQIEIESDYVIKVIGKKDHVKRALDAISSLCFK